MTTVMTPEQADAAVAAATAERDGIQANLLELDKSFGKRLLAGAALTGESKHRWAGTAADLARLWEIFPVYSAVVDRAATLLAAPRHRSAQLAEITSLLSGASVSVTRGLGPIEERDLASASHSNLTIPAAVQEMKVAFARATMVVAAAERVWNAMAGGLGEVTAELSAARDQASGLRDAELTEALAAAGAEAGRLRDLVNCDPLALWRGQPDTSALDVLRKRAGDLAGRAGDLARLRDEAQPRMAAATAAVTAIAAARRAAATARDRAAEQITAEQVAVSVLLPPPAETAGLDERLAGLDTLRAAGQWGRLAAELNVIETEAAAAEQRYRAAEQAASALLDQRDELRGLLSAYQAKAGRLGFAADPGVTGWYQQAHDLLGTVPCDLRAATAAVTSHKEAILALSEGRRPVSGPMAGMTSR